MPRKAITVGSLPRVSGTPGRIGTVGGGVVDVINTGGGGGGRKGIGNVSRAVGSRPRNYAGNVGGRGAVGKPGGPKQIGGGAKRR